VFRRLILRFALTWRPRCPRLTRRNVTNEQKNTQEAGDLITRPKFSEGRVELGRQSVNGQPFGEPAERERVGFTITRRRVLIRSLRRSMIRRVPRIAMAALLSATHRQIFA